MATFMSDGDQDDAAAARYNVTEGPCWTPEGWHKHPLQLEDEARAKNEVGYSSAFAAAGKHSQPPNHPSERSL